MKKLLTTLLGQITWKKPNWWLSFINICHKNIKKTIAILTVAIILVFLTSRLFWDYQHEAKAQILYAQIYLPTVIIKNQKQTPQPLRIVFGDKKPNNVEISAMQNDSTINEDNYVSVADLSQIGKIIPSGIEITPTISGQWQWQSDKILNIHPINTLACW